jgi:DNA-binding CsgD family transcriptional regulator
LRADLRAEGLSMRPRRTPPRPAIGWGSLTVTERAVVEHVGEGLTNSEIAERLFVSRRTVESHLGRVYPKLGLQSRPQLVAAVARWASEREGRGGKGDVSAPTARQATRNPLA